MKSSFDQHLLLCFFSSALLCFFSSSSILYFISDIYYCVTSPRTHLTAPWIWYWLSYLLTQQLGIFTSNCHSSAHQPPASVDKLHRMLKLRSTRTLTIWGGVCGSRFSIFVSDIYRYVLVLLLVYFLVQQLSASTSHGHSSVRAQRFHEDHSQAPSEVISARQQHQSCLLYTSPSPRDGLLSRMPSSA